MKNTPLKFRLNVIGGSLIIFVAIRTYLPLLARNIGLDSNFNIWIVVCILALILSCMLPIAFIEKMCDFHPVLFEKKKNVTGNVAVLPASMLLFILLAMVNSVVLLTLQKMGIVFPAQKLEDIDGIITFILYFVFSTIIPAVFEELYLRGIVFNLLLPNGKRFAIIASALIFTIMHTQVQSFIPVFGAGIILACIYMYTDNIFSAMALHFINNCYSFIMLYMQQRINTISYIGFSSFVMSAIIVTGIAGMLYIRKHHIDIFSPLSENEKNANLSKLISSPVMLLGIVSCLMAVFSQLYVDLAL